MLAVSLDERNVLFPSVEVYLGTVDNFDDHLSIKIIIKVRNGYNLNLWSENKIKNGIVSINF